MLAQQIFHHIEGRRIEPLQVVEKEQQRVFRPCEYSDESPQDQLKATLRIVWCKIWDRQLLSYNEL